MRDSRPLRAGSAEEAAPSLAFAYHRSLAPMMWVMVGLSAIELSVVHFLVSIWSVTLALILSAATVLGIAWLALLIRSFRRLPVVLDEDGILFRTGTLLSMRARLADIERVRGDFPSEALKTRSVLDFAMLSYPNVLVELRAPVRRGRRRTVQSLAHRLDDPDAFVAALGRRLGRTDEPAG